MTEKQLRTERINLRLTPAEHEKLLLKAKEHNLPIAVFLRDRVLELSPPVKQVHDLPKIDRELINELNGIGNNINQIARSANTQNARYNQVDIVTLHKQLALIAQTLANIEQRCTAK